MEKSTKLHNKFLWFDRTFSSKIWWQIIILIGFVLAALIVGLIICYFIEFGNNNPDVPFYEWALYLLIDGNALSNIYTDCYSGERPWVTLLFSIHFCSLYLVLCWAVTQGVTQGTGTCHEAGIKQIKVKNMKIFHSYGHDSL